MLRSLIYKQVWDIFNSSSTPAFYTVPVPLDQWPTNFPICILLFWAIFLCRLCLSGQNSTEASLAVLPFFPIDAFPPLHRLFLVIVSLAVAQHLCCFFQSFPKALIMFFHWFSHSQKMPPLLNLMPIVDLGNLNPCIFWCNSRILKLTQMQFEEILSYEVLHLPRLVGHDHGKC